MLVLGPVLRHVGETTAQVWVQTERAATVRVLGCEARTFEVSGHHFALVPVTGLAPDSRTPYEVHIDGVQVWPQPTSPFPPSLIRTRGPDCDEHNRIIFGSCRYSKVADPKLAAKLGIDALDAYSARMGNRPTEEWPDALLLLGDQVYADELTPANRRRIANRPERHPDWPDDEIVNFDEYVGLYRDAWSDPEIRWLLSTVPTAMIFDDHDVRDDWNTSASWRADMRATTWWEHRIRAGLASYWVFQHIGNLPPEELAGDPDHARVMAHDGDTWPLLVELADRADAETDGSKGVRFSFRWDLGRSRFVMIDSRNGRILEDGQHLMLGDPEFDWIENAVHAPGEVDHLVLGTSLPWLMPHAIGELQTVNEIAAAKPGWRGKLGEKIRQGADLEHWAAFQRSFRQVQEMVASVAAGERGPAPSTVTFLSGDVHNSYVSEVDRDEVGSGQERPSRILQAVCSPIRNPLPRVVRHATAFASKSIGSGFANWLARSAKVPDPPFAWRTIEGPWFDNNLATLETDGRALSMCWEKGVVKDDKHESPDLKVVSDQVIEPIRS